MKLLAFGIFLVCLHHVELSPIARSERKNVLEDDKSGIEELTNYVNRARVNFAEGSRISNMNRLKWNPNFNASLLECMNEDDIYRFRKRDHFSHELLMELVPKNSFIRCFHPNQSYVYCAKKKCPETKDIYACTCGPHTNISESDIVNGLPGLACTTRSTDGLCDLFVDAPQSSPKPDDDEEDEDESNAASNLFRDGAILNLIAMILTVSFSF